MPGSGFCSTPIRSSIARYSLAVMPVMSRVVTKVMVASLAEPGLRPVVCWLPRATAVRALGCEDLLVGQSVYSDVHGDTVVSCWRRLMEFRILGPLEVTEQGVSLALGPPLRRLMLAVLLCRPNQAVSQDRLVELLWAGRPPRTAAKNVQVHVYHLRKVLGDDRIRRESHGYLLRVEPGE